MNYDEIIMSLTEIAGQPTEDGMVDGVNQQTIMDALELINYQHEHIEAFLKDQEPTIGSWISVKDRLPETNDEVLATYLYDDKPNKRYVETASYFDDGEGEGHWHSVWDEFNVGRVRKTTIAWMPMPKPYKPPKEDKDDA